MVTQGETHQEVYFDVYCKTCKHKDSEETDKPCVMCLENPTNLYSHKPTHWESK